MCRANVCLMQRTTYSVSASVSCTGSDDLKSGPRPWNSGTAASCSGGSEHERECVCLQSIVLSLSLTTDTVHELTLINVLA